MKFPHSLPVSPCLSIALVFAAMAVGCNTQSAPLENPLPSRKFATAIQRVLDEDQILGDARNHASETNSLNESIDVYLQNIDQINWQDCPAQFTDAFQAHRDAWERSKSLFAKFPDLRGEMHGLFDKIREMPEHNAALLDVEKDIWGTWGEVEKAAKSFGVGDEQPTSNKK